MRQRDLFTRRNTLRARFLTVPLILAISIGLSGLSSPARDRQTDGYTPPMYYPEIHYPLQHQGFAALLPQNVLSPGDTPAPQNIGDGTPESLALLDSPPPESSPDPDSASGSDPVREEGLVVGAGQTLAGVFQTTGLSGREVYSIVQAVGEHLDPRRIRAGQRILVRYEAATPDVQDTDATAPPPPAYRVTEARLPLDRIRDVVVSRTEEDSFVSRIDQKPLVEVYRAGHAVVQNSLYGSAAKVGIPESVLANVIQIYSKDVDFKRDVRRNDSLNVLYTAFETEDGDISHTGDILHANLTLGGVSKPVYRHVFQDGQEDYFDPQGQSLTFSMMRVPVKGARVSSRFGMRRHPILGYNVMHNGIDYAAPTGTPVLAAGDGVVERANRFDAYGNYLRIRHNGTYQTAYAHLNGFARGITAGTRVRQGQVIGYVGSTGRSTGPHLHYEVLVNGKQVNPATVKLPKGEPLQGEELRRFKARIAEIDSRHAELTRPPLSLAQNDLQSLTR